MLKQKITIWLIGLMCSSIVNGYSTVLCHGPDGHIAIKSAVHNHCRCPDPDHNNKQNKVPERPFALSVGHGHCKDTMATQNALLPERNNIKQTIYKIFTAKLHLKTFLNRAPSFFNGFTAQGSELSSFHTPLRSIILLA